MKGYHSFVCLGVPFHVHRRYTFLRELGIGAYGCVALARDSVLDCDVAIKKVTRVFERDVLARRALREVAVLRHIGMCGNVTALLDFDTSFIEFNEIYLVMEASEADLSQIIRSGQTLSDSHLQYFLAQLLRGVRYMHAANIIHRDLKPGNLLVNADCQLKICDFGLARAHAERPERRSRSRSYSTSAERQPRGDRGKAGTPPTQDGAAVPASEVSSSSDDSHSKSLSPMKSPPDAGLAQAPAVDTTRRSGRSRSTRLYFPGGPLTEYVATRWYRAPEVMLCFRRGYGAEIDVWSIGCILAELIAGKPLFAGKDYVDQIARINNVLGTPTEATIAKIGSQRAKTYVQSLPKMPKVPFSNLFPKATPLALDLLDRMLTWDPDERISADEALRHPWLAAYHQSNAAWTPPEPYSRFDEVEAISTITEFRLGLEREAEEMRAELLALEAEEQREEEERLLAEADGATTTDQGDDGPQLGGSQDQTQSGASRAVDSDLSGSAQSASLRASTEAPSPLHTPSSVDSLDAYETDPTSASAPQSINGSTYAPSAGTPHLGFKKTSNHVSSHNNESGRGDFAGEVRLRMQELDESLASHALLKKPALGGAELNHETYRRRAISNAACIPRSALRRVASSRDDNDASQDGQVLNVQYLVPSGALSRVPPPSFIKHTTDIITRSKWQRECVTPPLGSSNELVRSVDEQWREHRLRWAAAEASMLSQRPKDKTLVRPNSSDGSSEGGHAPFPSSASPRASALDASMMLERSRSDSDSQSREGSDSTIGHRGGRSPSTLQASPVPA
ncbi:kinase-like protein [Ceraceosorus bombacis]|uniref:Mitogen-activated protein kinase n=1 Tax=Ceraceosorus bombacis TaxID=401625 RepID=A0A0P1B9Q8_9BASI|nr:kinase-like protein [Ceraceosorus bombacis]